MLSNLLAIMAITIYNQMYGATIRKAGKKYVKPKTSLLVELLWVKKLQKIFALKKFRHIKSIQKQVNASEREKEGDVE